MPLTLELETLRALTLGRAPDDRQLANWIQALSQGLTCEREQFLPQYGMSVDLVSAYSLFYMPTNIPKLRFVLELLPAWLQRELGQCAWVDWCTGPGTYLLALLDYFENLEHKESRLELPYVGIDRSELMLKQAQKNLHHFFPDKLPYLSFATQLPMSRESDAPRAFLWGNGVNEMGEQKVAQLIDQQQPEYVLFIEPGTKAVFEQMMKLRSALLTQGYIQHYPCPGSNACQMLGRDDWCHQVLYTTHDPSIERISQMAKLDRRTMPLIAQVYSRKAPADHASSFAGPEQYAGRLVRRGAENKHALNWQVCLHDHQLIWLEIPKRGLSKQDLKAWDQRCVGEWLSFKQIKILRPDQWRVQL